MNRRVLFDSHHHLWPKAETPRAGILGEAYLDREVRWDDYTEAASGCEVEGTCLVEATSEPDEVTLAEDTSRQDARLRAMVAFAPVESPGLGTVLGDLAQHPIVRGVRRSTQAEPDRAFILRPEFVQGAWQVGQAGLLLELCVRFEQIAAMPQFARECPDTVVVVQHLGKPDVSVAPDPGWLRAIEELGACPNVHVKVSPVVHTAQDARFTLQTQRPFIRHVVEALGWDRVLFGSNWPVATAVTTYQGWVEIVAESLGDATDAQLEALFHTNARRLLATRA